VRVTEELVMLEAVTAEITGAGAEVVKVALGDVAEVPAEFAETTAKS
jgi:hypothetical protein